MMPLAPDWQMPDPLPIVSTEMLQAAMEIGTTAAAGHGFISGMLEDDPPGFAIQDDDGEVKHYRFRDTPLNRFLFAVKDLSPMDPDRRTAICLRAWKLSEVIYDRRFRHYVRPTDHPEIHQYSDVLAKVVASIPYPLHDSPSLQEILREVRKREAQGPQADLFGGA